MRLVITFGLVAILAAGCNAPTTPAQPAPGPAVSEPAKKAPEASPQQAAAPQKEPEPERPRVRPMPKEPLTEENILKNDSFETCVEGKPWGWQAVHGTSEADWKEIDAACSDESATGESALSVPEPEEGKLVLVRQRIPWQQVGPGQVVSFGARVKAPEPQTVAVIVRYRDKEGELGDARVVNTSTDWERLQGFAELPKNIDPDLVTFTIQRTAGAEGDVLVDEVRMGYGRAEDAE